MLQLLPFHVCNTTCMAHTHNNFLSNPAESCLCNSVVSTQQVSHDSHTLRSRADTLLDWCACLSTNQAAYLNSKLMLNQIRELLPPSDNKAARNLDGAPDYQTGAQCTFQHSK